MQPFNELVSYRYAVTKLQREEDDESSARWSQSPRVQLIHSGWDVWCHWECSIKRVRRVATKQNMTIDQSRPSRESQPFLDWARSVVDARKDKVFARWYDDNGHLTVQRSFQQMWDEAGKISHHLREKWGVEKGDRVVLCYDFGLHFFEVFFGCLRAGIVAVLGKARMCQFDSASSI